jgi:peptidylprolyl isomerase
MKIRHRAFIAVFAVAGLIACVAAKGGKDPQPNDGVSRKWTSTPIKPKKQKAVKLPCGIEYTITHKGNGPKPVVPDDRAQVLYKGYITGDTSKVFDASSRHGNVPYSFHPGRGGEVIAGWDSVIKYLNAGDRAIMKLPAKYAYGAQARPGIPANSDLTFEIEVVDVLKKPAKWDGTGKDTITTPSGLKMIMFVKNPDSALVKQGNTVALDYSGYLLNGYMFDSSIERGQPLTYVVGQMPLIQGWSEAVNLMREGEKAQVIIPWQLAYGANGRPPMIPAKADLIFDMHLVNIK